MADHPSSAPVLVKRDDRAILRLSGPDVRPLLQGLVTNDVMQVRADRSVYAALLTPQGKFLFDFTMIDDGEDLLLEAEAARAETLVKRLSLYRLRAKAEIGLDTTLAVWALLDPRADAPGTTAREDGRIVVTDPRLPMLGSRIIAPRGTAPGGAMASGTLADYDRRRLALGVPEAPQDMQPDKSFLLECNFEELHGVDFRKGCYVGQELTARTKHRNAVKRRLLPLDFEGPVPAPGTPVMAQEREIGTVTSAMETRALALIRLERWADARAAGHGLDAGGTPVTITVPEWLELAL